MSSNELKPPAESARCHPLLPVATLFCRFLTFELQIVPLKKIEKR